MTKNLTPSQWLGEIGESAARTRFLKIGFQFDGRSRLEAGIDGIAEVMDGQRPTAKMIAVQVKAREKSKYASEDDRGFTYMLKSEDLAYWQGSNLPVIVVLYRQSDESYYWKEVPTGLNAGERRLSFDKEMDVLDVNAVDRLAALTVPKNGFGYYVPPLGGGEEALVNMLPIGLPKEVFVSSTPYTGKQATAILFDHDDAPRFDWVIHGGSFWSFHDPRSSSCRHIVDVDQVEAIETAHLAFHEDITEQNIFAYLLKNTLRHQVREDLWWSKDKRLLYFRALKPNEPRKFAYESSKKKTEADVVNVAKSKKHEGQVDFVRHHAFVPRFERLEGEWYLIVNPTYFFTINGFTPHSYPSALLAGKKRMDNSASLRGQVIMWHRFLTQRERAPRDLFVQKADEELPLKFGEPPKVSLETRVPEDVWGAPKKHEDEPEPDGQERMAV